MPDLKWYRFDQNNSGGYTIVNEDVGEDLFIEADSQSSAISKMLEITEDHSDYCECCGERWSAYIDDESDVPSKYGKPISDGYSAYGNGHAVLFFADGHREYFSQH